MLHIVDEVLPACFALLYGDTALMQPKMILHGKRDKIFRLVVRFIKIHMVHMEPIWDRPVFAFINRAMQPQ